MTVFINNTNKSEIIEIVNGVERLFDNNNFTIFDYEIRIENINSRFLLYINEKKISNVLNRNNLKCKILDHIFSNLNIVQNFLNEYGSLYSDTVSLLYFINKKIINNRLKCDLIHFVNNNSWILTYPKYNENIRFSYNSEGNYISTSNLIKWVNDFKNETALNLFLNRHITNIFTFSTNINSIILYKKELNDLEIIISIQNPEIGTLHNITYSIFGKELIYRKDTNRFNNINDFTKCNKEEIKLIVKEFLIDYFLTL